MEAREADAQKSGRILMMNHFGERFFEGGKGTPDFLTLWNKKNESKSLGAHRVCPLKDYRQALCPVQEGRVHAH